MDLETLGWSDRQEQEFGRLASATDVRGRVLAEHKDSYRVWTQAGHFDARVTGKFLQEGADVVLPATGDFVVVTPPLGAGPALIQQVLARKTAFVRKAAGEGLREQVVAANIDFVFVLCGLDHDFNLRRLERYLTLAWQGGVQPVIVLSKADLCPELPARLEEVRGVAPNVPCLAISAQSGSGLERLAPYLQRGTTVGVLGSSGVGKSTLVNALLGVSVQETAPVREDDSRGRHTTTHRELFVLPSGACIIDTPGMRELQLLQADQGLPLAFAEITALAAQCRFADCRHEREPGCAVRAAVERGELAAERLASNQRLAREVELLELRAGPATLERKRRERIGSKALKAFKKGHS